MFIIKKKNTTTRQLGNILPIKKEDLEKKVRQYLFLIFYLKEIKYGLPLMNLLQLINQN